MITLKHYVAQTCGSTLHKSAKGVICQVLTAEQLPAMSFIVGYTKFEIDKGDCDSVTVISDGKRRSFRVFSSTNETPKCFIYVGDNQYIGVLSNAPRRNIICAVLLTLCFISLLLLCHSCHNHKKIDLGRIPSNVLNTEQVKNNNLTEEPNTHKSVMSNSEDFGSLIVDAYLFDDDEDYSERDDSIQTNSDTDSELQSNKENIVSDKEDTISQTSENSSEVKGDKSTSKKDINSDKPVNYSTGKNYLGISVESDTDIIDVTNVTEAYSDNDTDDVGEVSSINTTIEHNSDNKIWNYKNNSVFANDIKLTNVEETAVYFEGAVASEDVISIDLTDIIASGHKAVMLIVSNEFGTQKEVLSLEDLN